MTRKISRRPRRGQCVLPAMMFLALLFAQGALADHLGVVDISYWDYVEGAVGPSDYPEHRTRVVRFQGAAGDRIRVQVWRLIDVPNVVRGPYPEIDDYRCVGEPFDCVVGDYAPPYLEITGRLPATGSYSMHFHCAYDEDCYSPVAEYSRFGMFLTLMEPEGEPMDLRPAQSEAEGSPVRGLDWGVREAAVPPRRLDDPPPDKK